MTYYGHTEKAEQMEKLVGAKVSEIKVGPGEHDLRLITDKGILCMDTDGDCCSESWWADIIGVNQLLGYQYSISNVPEVTAFEEIEMPSPIDARSRQEEDQAYGYKIRTTQGECTLIFRNSSNGYYGGSCGITWAPEDYEVPEDFKSVSEDWSA